MSRRSSILVALLFLGVVAFGQEKPSTPKDTTKAEDIPFYELDEIVVTGSRSTRPILRVPMAIDVVSIEEVQRAQASVSLSEIFRTLPGIAVDNRYNPSNGERLVIRGSGSRGQIGIRGIKILLDGIPLTTPDGASSLTTLSLGSLARVEVIRGAASSLYGNAANGVINLTTAIGQRTPLSVQAKMIAGSYGLRKWEGSALGRSGNTGYAVNIDRTLSDGFRVRSESKLVRVNAVGTHDFSNTMQLLASFSYYNAPYLLNPSGLTKTELKTNRTMAATSYFNAGAGQQDKQWMGGLTFKYDDGLTQGFDGTVFYKSKERTSATPPAIGDTDVTSGGARLLYRKQFTLGSMPVQLSIGADYEQQSDTRLRYRSRGLPPDKRGTTGPDQVLGLVQRDTLNEFEVDGVSSIGPFMALEVELSPQWILLLGSRYDRFNIDSKDKFFNDGSDDSGSRTVSHFSPSAGLLYRMLQYSSVYANISTGFQVPTLTELRYRADGLGGLNFDLEPELVISVETGIKGVLPQSRLAYDLSLFSTSYEDLLISYQIPGSSDTFYRNAGKASNKGVEGKLQWEPVDGLRGSLAVTVMDFTFDDYRIEQTVSGQRTQVQLKGKKIPAVSPARIYFGGSYRHSSGIFSEVNLQWVQEAFTNDFNGTPPGGTKPASDYVNESYTNIDARFGFTQTIATLDVELFAGANNVLDTKYVASLIPNGNGDRFFEPAPGRNWYAGLRILFTAIK